MTRSKEPLIGPQVVFPTPWRVAEQNQYGYVIACSVGHQAASVGDPELGELICDLVNAAGEDERLVDRLRTQLHECAAAATEGHKEWLQWTRRMAVALGLPETATAEEVVLAAERSWSIAQGIVEGTLVDDGPTELPGAWTQDNGPPTQSMPLVGRKFKPGDLCPDDLVEVWEDIPDGRLWVRSEDGATWLWAENGDTAETVWAALLQLNNGVVECVEAMINDV